MNGSKTEPPPELDETFVRRERNLAEQPTNHWVAPGLVTRPVSIPIQAKTLAGRLCVPSNSGALILLSHTDVPHCGYARSEGIARWFAANGMAVLEFDLSTADRKSARNADGAFDLGLLALRIVT